jgi:AraC-like DNA-binding protein/mannose-6-phosphate isomerase-like protein (cupin superfamily)
MFNSFDHQSLDAVRESAGRLGEPASYYRGTGPLTIEVPRNVLVFARNRRDDLHGSSTLQYHYHHRFVLICDAGGRGTVIVDGRRVELGEGQALLIFPHQYHHYVGTGSEPICWVYITFEVTVPEPLLPLRNQPVVLAQQTRGYLHELLFRYTDATATPPQRDDATSLLAGLVLCDLEASVSEGLDGDPAEEREERQALSVVDRVNRYVYEHSHRPLSVEGVAREMSLSVSHLRRLFRAEMGISIRTYIQRVKMNRALSLLSSSALNVSEVADACGYQSVYAFSRAFKRELRLPPTEYRSRILAQL